MSHIFLPVQPNYPNDISYSSEKHLPVEAVLLHHTIILVATKITTGSTTLPSYMDSFDFCLLLLRFLAWNLWKETSIFQPSSGD